MDTDPQLGTHRRRSAPSAIADRSEVAAPTLAETASAGVGASLIPEDSKATRLLQRVLLPRPGEPLDVRTLYLVESATNARRAHSPTRTSLTVGADSEVSFATYFNAFPASYWRRWTVLSSVILRVSLNGRGRIDVYRTKADGARIHLQGREFDDSCVEIEVALDCFEDGGWIWFDLHSDVTVEIRSGGWYAPIDPAGEGTIAVGIPTFNRPIDCVNALSALSSDPHVLATIEAVIVPDQGTEKAKDASGFSEAATALGNRLVIHDQPNLGGSGGYSRIMYEALKKTKAQYILFMDDDIAIEPDSILRALAFARFSKVPTLVGGQMLNLQARSHLHVMGEVLDRNAFMWTAGPNAEYDHNFSEKPLADRAASELLHRRVDVDFNGWWMCLIPRSVAERLGQPLPLFIKWDDVEFGLRAAKSGFPTVTLPGTAIWHMAWSDKDDAIDWQSYFHLRNRLVVAALYHEGDGRNLVLDTVKATLKHLLCLEYSTVAIQNRAIRDFLAGPGMLWELLPTALGEVHDIRKHFPDAVIETSSAQLPPASGRDIGVITEPHGPLSRAFRLLKGVVHQVRVAHPEHHRIPQLNLATIDARWYVLSQVDGVTVTTADGSGVVYRKRDRRRATGLLIDALRLRRILAKRFPQLKDEYRAAHSHLTSMHAWEDVWGLR